MLLIEELLDREEEEVGAVEEVAIVVDEGEAGGEVVDGDSRKGEYHGLGLLRLIMRSMTAGPFCRIASAYCY
jgi:hypothetical protein